MNIKEYAAWTEETWVAPKAYIGDVALVGLGLAGETGEVVEVLKKFLRDGRLNRDKLEAEMGDVIYYWARLCQMFAFDPEDIMLANQKKLIGRLMRGTLNGSGDDR